MTYLSILLLFMIGCASQPTVSSQVQIDQALQTEVSVVELKNYSFKADSFFAERKNIVFDEVPAGGLYQEWVKDAVEKVNVWIPEEDRLKSVKLKLIFTASITGSNKRTYSIPISNIESYQEPKTNSIRLGMLELKNSEQSFKLTVAHEYAHLVLENASRIAGSTQQSAEQMTFWPKSVYEGAADFLMSIALHSNLTAAADDWSVRKLDDYQTIKDARSEKSQTISRARKAFTKFGLVPQMPIYVDWLTKANAYIKQLGGVDPYAEGTWVAGTLVSSAQSAEQKRMVVNQLLQMAKTGRQYDDSEKFVSDLLGSVQ